MSVTSATKDPRTPPCPLHGVIGVRDRLGPSRTRFAASIDRMNETAMHGRIHTYLEHLDIEQEASPQPALPGS